MITGGGESRNVLLLNPQKGFKIKALNKMISCRREHSTLYVDGHVYVLGGYDGEQLEMLASCERYSLSSKEWSRISAMNIRKCAFGAASWKKEHIYTFGGFNGNLRLSQIERYRIDDNRWTILKVELKEKLSNTAAIYTANEKILILGGGSDQGFILDVFEFDCRREKVVNVSRMSEGRDLRNKLSYVNGSLYVCGGNTCQSEKYLVRSNTWS